MRIVRLIKESWITTRIILGMCLFHSIWFFFKLKMYSFFEIKDYFLVLMAFPLLFIFLEGTSSVLKNKALRSIFSIIFIPLYFLMGRYHFRVSQSFDYSIFIDNFNEMFHKASFGVMTSIMKPKDIGYFLFFILLLIVLQLTRRIFTRSKGILSNRLIGVFFLLAFYLFVYILPYPYEEFTYTTKTALSYYFPKSEFELNEKDKRNNKEKFKVSSKRLKKQPHIFMVMIESFNGLYVNKKTENGKEVTPIFNSLIKDGLYIDQFYGNSIQTIKGQFSIFCSQIPLARGKSSLKLNGKNMNCMPRKLKEMGYYTYFHKGYEFLDFDNTKNFMHEIGFDLVQNTNTKKMNEKDKKEKIWGWGVQDDVTYTQFVEKISELDKAGKRVFANVHSLTHHMKFDKIPVHLQFLHPGTTDKVEMFENSLYLSDLYFKTFIDELKKKKLFDNSIIIITGDHSYPAGEHGLHNSHVGYYEEFFRTPFLAIWKGEITPHFIKKKTFSHVDIFPTVFDLLGESGEFDGVGQSIFTGEPQFTHLIQPYSGMSLSSVRYPFKYVWERRSDKESFYNLEADPNELIDIKEGKDLSSFRKAVGKIFYDNSQLLKQHKR